MTDIDPAIRSKLSGLHFAKEALSDNERETLWLAEQVLTAHDDLAAEVAALREKVQRVEALADDLTWKRPDVCPCSPETIEACCGSESSCDAMQPSTKVVGSRTIRAALNGTP
jgi:hypothetical protein